MDTTYISTSDSARILSWDSVNHVVYVTYDKYSVDSTFLDSTQLTNQFTNRHSYITIPALIGYEWSLRKWNFNLNVGLGMSFLVKNRAQNINYELTNFITTNPKKFILNYVVSPTINYQINPQVGLEINPQVIVNSSSLINYKDVNQTYTNVGLTIGINYSFSQF